jgi:hypothetical protein
MNQNVSTVIITNTISGGGSSGGSSNVFDNIRANAESVFTGITKTVNFLRPLASTPNVLFCMITASGSITFPNVERSTITTSSFQIAGNEIIYDGILSYMAAIAT